MPDNLDQVLESTQSERLATDFVFTEGPLWHPDGHWLFVDVRRSLMFRVTPSGELSTFREDTNGANGLTFDLQGRLIMCEGDGRKISRQEPDGSMTTLTETSQGKRLNRPNDLATLSDGSVYFTNPGGRIAPADREIDFSGVHRIAPDGSVTAVTGELDYPNGLAFSPNERTLYVAITRKDDGCIQEKERGEECTHQFIKAFDVAAEGSLSNERVFANLFSAHDGVPDGMKVDISGRVFCVGSGGIWVVEPTGEIVGVIKGPAVPRNIAFGDADLRTLYTTPGDSVYSVRVKTPGIVAF